MTDAKTDLKSMLKDPGLLETRAYIGGKWVDGDDGTFDVMNPARGDVIAPRVEDLVDLGLGREVRVDEVEQELGRVGVARHRVADPFEVADRVAARGEVLADSFVVPRFGRVLSRLRRARLRVGRRRDEARLVGGDGLARVLRVLGHERGRVVLHLRLRVRGEGAREMSAERGKRVCVTDLGCFGGPIGRLGGLPASLAVGRSPRFLLLQGAHAEGPAAEDDESS